MNFTPPPVKTEFNSNLATLMRIDNALKMAAECSIIDEFEGWFKALGILRREAIPKMTDEQVTECNKLFLKLEKDLALLNKSKGGQSFFNTKIDNQLDEFEVYMRLIMDKKGMLLRDGEDDSFRALK